MRSSILTLAFILLAYFPLAARALDAQAIGDLTAEDSDVRIAALGRIISAGDLQARPFLQSLLDDTVKKSDGKAYIVGDTGATDALTGAVVELPETAEDVVNNNRMRGMLEAAMAALDLRSEDATLRTAAVGVLLQADYNKNILDAVRAAENTAKDPLIRDQLAEIRSGMELRSDDRLLRLNAARELASSESMKARERLLARLEDGGEPDAEVRDAIEASLKNMDRHLAFYESAGTVFAGVSLGSVLLLAALGLAITYGLMGVINMAHGEMMMLGAYMTYLVQGFFQKHFPAYFDGYVIFAIPFAFVVTALVGMVLERLVIRHLYGRPLETLLSTWGISLVLMQLVRSLFGAQNVQLENPAWLSGGIAVASNLVLPYNRIAIIVFSLAVLLLVWLLLNKTRMGLFVRAVTQNRTMARCVGVNTDKVDMMAFGLGSGIAGLAGVALSQIGNVGPSLGQSYIVDSFMVVVLGGVGQLAGTVYAALGLGVISKFLEGYAGAVLAKIIVLVIIIIFIQKRPQGLFALKGRSAD